MLEFLATTHAGRRLRIQEKEKEEMRRCRNDTWGLKGERLEGSEAEEEWKRETGGGESEEEKGEARAGQ